MQNTARIRVVTPEDAPQLLEIYRPYVEHTAVSFEWDVPTEEEFQARIQKTLQKYPYFAAEDRGELLGYAYLGPFVGRRAYEYAAETTIYLRRECRKMGLGRQLYTALEETARAQNLCSLCACIGVPEQEDEYLTLDSVRFHEHMGYRMVGTFSRCGYKFGRWYGMAWMEKIIAPHLSPAPDRIDFPDLTEAFSGFRPGPGQEK